MRYCRNRNAIDFCLKSFNRKAFISLQALFAHNYLNMVMAKVSISKFLFSMIFILEYCAIYLASPCDKKQFCVFNKATIFWPWLLAFQWWCCYNFSTRPSCTSEPGWPTIGENNFTSKPLREHQTNGCRSIWFSHASFYMQSRKSSEKTTKRTLWCPNQPRILKKMCVLLLGFMPVIGWHE